MQREYSFHDPYEISPNSLLIRAFLNFPMPATCVWDIGTGCGKVLIESYFRYPGAVLIGFDPDERAHAHLKLNMQRHGLDKDAIQLIPHLVQDANLSALQRPDAIYLGCSGDTSDETLAGLWEALKPGGVITGSVGHRLGADNPEYRAKMDRLYVWQKQYGGVCNEYTTSIALTDSQRRMLPSGGHYPNLQFERVEWIGKKPA
jgi:SAM-dependent methyltransferase